MHYHTVAAVVTENIIIDSSLVINSFIIIIIITTKYYYSMRVGSFAKGSTDGSGAPCAKIAGDVTKTIGRRPAL